ncbi:hypothetical protein POL68_02515 [Stigmatella sp. ncwal1]|uniref:N,N-dimethylformamidase beta subunit-like C-terminal domain-containing protein n=1 Tax=Stigmatella ashevillensis TaxID=2995309 RepID=A0ABT5D0Z2_9BACT|nr:N,N-dimethylformamidase beta subunit family domain-containing protein [Stigmatella ashevillena]MDC0707333.1 hypothetical protein [Stigmatella ashevillena]
MVGKTPWGVAVVGMLWACSVHGSQSVAAPQEAPVSPAVRFVRAKGSESLRARRGDPSWRRGKPAKPGELDVHVSRSAAHLGEPVSVKVSASGASVLGASVLRMEVFRLGFYGGAGALKVWDAGSLKGDSPETFSFSVGDDWVPGLYLVKVTRADGLRSFRSLVVKARRGTEPRT